MHLKRRTFLAAQLFALAVGIVAGAAVTSHSAWGRPPMLAQAPTLPQAPTVPVQMPLTTGTFAKVAEAIKPAVVNINTVSRGGGGVGGGRTPFEEFFGEEFFKRFFGDAPERMPQRSLGSGVIVDPTGIAL